MAGPRRLLTVGHSYAVALNRRLPHELARVGAGRWEVTAAAPEFVHGDLRPVALERFAGEANRLAPVTAYLTARPHVMLYGRGLRRVFAERWDLIHCWEEPFVLAGAQVARWSRGRPLVYYTFQNIPKRYPPPFNWVERYATGRAAAWLAAGHTVESALADRAGYAGKPRRVMPLGVDVEAFRPDAAAGAAVRSELGWKEPGPPVVGFLGRFVPEKGLAMLTAALDSIRAPWRALFVGGGELEPELRAWAARHADGRAKVVTGVPHDAVPRYISAMDVLAAPSQTTTRWKEQLGRMLIEAMACGVPVIGSDSGEIPHVIGDAGAVLPESDPAAWTATLGELLENPARRAERGAAGLARAHSAFAWPVIARRHLDFFDKLLDSRG
jgi:glycosyltransferase involved in cell wall biosynthesis